MKSMDDGKMNCSQHLSFLKPWLPVFGMGIPLKTEHRRSRTTVFSVRQPVRRAETFRCRSMQDQLSKGLGRLATRFCYRAFACAIPDSLRFQF